MSFFEKERGGFSADSVVFETRKICSKNGLFHDKSTLEVTEREVWVILNVNLLSSNKIVSPLLVKVVTVVLNVIIIVIIWSYLLFATTFFELMTTLLLVSLPS